MKFVFYRIDNGDGEFTLCGGSQNDNGLKREKKVLVVIAKGKETIHRNPHGERYTPPKIICPYFKKRSFMEI